MEWYEQVHEERRQKYLAAHKEFYTYPSTAALEPFRIADGLYYVGDKKVCIHLLETADGLILLDSGYYNSRHLLTESIRKLGFDPADVRWILHTHEHFDHFGAADEFRNLYGTKLAISAVGAQSLREYPQRALIDWSSSPYDAIPEFDYELQDGEVFEFGGVKIRCVLTPGHALGVMSFFFEVTDNGETYLAGLFGGAGYTAMTVEYMKSVSLPLDMPQKMLESLDKMEKEPVVVHLGNHPGNNKTLKKRAQQLEEGGNPFVDPGSWQAQMETLRAKTLEIIAKNEETLKAH